jgi:ribosome-binding factor A
MFKRSERVQELLRHEISNFLLEEVTEPQLGFVTITGVEISGDLQDAKVFYSVLGTEEERITTTRILIRLIPRMRHHMGRKLESLYKAPRLQFVYDHTPERAQRVIDILNHLHDEETPPSASEENKK